MKKKLTLFLLLITVAITTIDARTWGMGLIQQEEKMVNFDDKQDYFNFIKNGKPFPMDPSTLYYDKSTKKPVTMSYYKKMVPLLQQVHNQSWLAQLTYINAVTKGQLAKDFGFTFSDFSGHLDEALQVFMSDKVIYGPAPNELVTYDGVDIDKATVHVVLRDAYINKQIGIHEHGWWLYLTGYDAIYIKSAECNNNTSDKWLATHIKKLAEAPKAPAPKKAETLKRYYDDLVIIEEKVVKKTNTSITSTNSNNSTISARTATAVATTSGSGSFTRNVTRNSNLGASANAVSGTGTIVDLGTSTVGTSTATSTPSDDDEEYGAAGNVQK